VGADLTGNCRQSPPRQEFPVHASSDPEFALFNWKVSTSAVATMLLAGVAAVFRRPAPSGISYALWMMVALATASAIMMFPVSLWFWRHLPKLQFLQFPWRWLVPLGIPYAFFLASLITQARWRWIWYSALALIIAATATAIVSRRLVVQRRHPIPRSGNSHWPRLLRDR